MQRNVSFSPVRGACDLRWHKTTGESCCAARKRPHVHTTSCAKSRGANLTHSERARPPIQSPVMACWLVRCVPLQRLDDVAEEQPSSIETKSFSCTCTIGAHVHVVHERSVQRRRGRCSMCRVEATNVQSQRRPKVSHQAGFTAGSSMIRGVYSWSWV